MMKELVVLFDRDNWDEFMDGFMVRDCTIGFEDGRLGFLLFQEMDTDDHMEDGFDIWILSVRLNAPMESRFFALPADDLSVSGQLSSAWSPNTSELVAVGAGQSVYAYKPKTYKGQEPGIPFEGGKLRPDAAGEFGCAIYKTVRVGTTVFALGTPFRIFERTGPNQWREHIDIPIPSELGSSDRTVFRAALDECAFQDMAGLSEDDLYAVGQAGTIWRRKGGLWKQMPFPSNLGLHTVAVAPDGTAYVTDMRGSVWKGREDRWERIVESNRTLAYEDSVWFNGRLYCTNDSSGCFVLEDGQMVAAHRCAHDPMPAETAVHGHRLDVSPDGKQLLLAGNQGATLYDGKVWTVLFNGEPEE